MGGTIKAKAKKKRLVTQTAKRRTTAAEATRKRLHKAALDLFSEKGYSATSTRDVAASLGVQQGSLYYHMKNKEELLHGICYSSLATLVERAEAAVAAASDPLQAFREVARNHLVTTLELQKQFSVGVMECRALGPEYLAEIQGLWVRYHELTSSVVDKAKAAGVLRCDVLSKYIYTPLECTLIWTVLWFRKGKGLNAEQLDKIFASVVFDGAGSPQARRNFRSRNLEGILESLTSQASPIHPPQKNETYARLLDTACSLFARKGYNSTSIREIADAMGIQKASLYYYISTKEDLIYEISRAALEHVSTSVKWALTQVSGTEERLYAFITAHVVSLLQHQNWHACANEELVTFTSSRRNQIVELRDEYESMARGLIAEAQDAGLIRKDVSAKYLGLVLFGMITHIYPWYQPGIDISPAELGFVLADVFITGIAPDRSKRLVEQ